MVEESEAEARERRELQGQRWWDSLPDAPRPWAWEAFAHGAEYEARHISTRTTPDPAPPVSPELPDGCNDESERRLARQVESDSSVRTVVSVLSDDDRSVHIFREPDIGDTPTVEADGATPAMVLYALHRAGLLPGATLTEDQRRDLRAMAALREHRIRVERALAWGRTWWRASLPGSKVGKLDTDPADAILSTLGGDK